MQDTRDSLHRFHLGVKRLTLENGMKVLLRPDASAPVVSVQIWVGAGSIHEQEFLGAGLSHYIEHMIFKGTPTRPVGQITRDINDAGGHVNAYTSFDRTVFFADMPSPTWRVGFDVLADAVINADFPEAEWEREREVVLREVSMGKDNPDRVIGEMLWKTAYLTHPYRFPVIGLPALLKQVTRADLLAFFQRNYVPDKMIVVVAGDFDVAEAEALIRKAFETFNRKPHAPIVLPQEPPQVTSRAARQEGNYGVTRLMMSWHTVPLSHPDTAALDMIAAITGNGRSSRLVRNILERKQLVDGISSFSYNPKEAGLFGVEATYEPEKEAEVLAALDAEVQSWLDKPFTPAELEKARRAMVQQALSPLQTANGQATSLASDEFYTGDFAFSESYLKRLEALTPAELRDVCARYFKADKRTLVILSPPGAAAAAPPAAAAAAGAVQRIVLANGITLLLREDHRLPFVHLCAALRGGVRDETEQQNGVYRLMSDLLVRGTGKRSSEQIADELEALGADLAPFSGFNSFGLKGRCLKADLPVLLDVAADCLTNPRFPEDEVTKQKMIQTAAIRQQLDRPMFHASRALFEKLFAGHPYRFDPLGTETGVAALGSKECAAAFRRSCAAGNLVLALFGDLTAEQAIKLVEAEFAGLPADPPPAREPARAEPSLPARIETKLPREQTIVLIGFPGASALDPERDALSVLQNALSGLSSTLMDEIREKRGLAYYAGAYERVAPDVGAFVMYAGTRDEALEEVERLIRLELGRIREKGLNQDEIDRARNQMVSEYQMGLQDNLSLAFTCAMDELVGLGCNYVFTTEARLKAVTGEAIRKAAAARLTDALSLTSVVRPQTPAAPGPAAPAPAPAAK
jgi:zinc protease